METAEIIAALSEQASLIAAIHRFDRPDLPSGFIPSSARLMIAAAERLRELSAESDSGSDPQGENAEGG